MILQGKNVEQQEEKFKLARRLDKGRQHKKLEEEKVREKERKLEKNKLQQRFVFRGHKDVFRTKPVEKKQKQSAQNKGDKNQEEIAKYLELNPASEQGRALMEALLAASPPRTTEHRGSKKLANDPSWRANSRGPKLSESSSRPPL